jgi:hypothetical protein
LKNQIRNTKAGINCNDIDCEHGQAVSQVFGCQCVCDDGYTGSLCEITIPTEVGDPCIEDILCTEEGQICSSNQFSRATGFCICDTDIGYIKDEFLPSETYSECVGPVPSCIVDSDCLLNQDCIAGFCTCIDLPGVGDMCLKGEVSSFKSI